MIFLNTDSSNGPPETSGSGNAWSYRLAVQHLPLLSADEESKAFTKLRERVEAIIDLISTREPGFRLRVQRTAAQGKDLDVLREPTASLTAEAITTEVRPDGTDEEPPSRERVDVVLALACRVRDDTADRSFRQPLGHLIEQAQQFQHRLIQANLRLVLYLARQYVHRGVPFPDLVQEGNLGLMRAVARFDPALGHKFSTYAHWWILQAIRQLVGDNRSLVRYPLHISERLARIHACARRVYQETGVNMDLPEVARRLGLSESEVQKCLRLAHSVVSTEQPLFEDERLTLGDHLASENGQDGLELTEQADLVRWVSRMLGWLRPREQQVLRYRYGIGLSRRYSLEEVSGQLGLTRERIRQIEIGALQRIRERLAFEQIDDEGLRPES